MIIFRKISYHDNDNVPSYMSRKGARHDAAAAAAARCNACGRLCYSREAESRACEKGEIRKRGKGRENGQPVPFLRRNSGANRNCDDHCTVVVVIPFAPEGCLQQSHFLMPPAFQEAPCSHRPCSPCMPSGTPDRPRRRASERLAFGRAGCNTCEDRFCKKCEIRLRRPPYCGCLNCFRIS